MTLAVHFRGVPDNRVNDGIDKVTKRVKPHLAKGILELMAGDRVLEIRPRGVNKGKVVRNIVTGHPGYYPIYIGDDFTGRRRVQGDQGGRDNGQGIRAYERNCRRLSVGETGRGTELFKGPDQTAGRVIASKWRSNGCWNGKH